MNDILANHSWPHPILTRIHEPNQRPTRERVLQCAEQCNANAAAITTSTLGAPGFGLLGITTSAADYQNATGQAWVEPAAPANVVADGGTQYEIAERQRVHRHAVEQWRLYQQANTTIRNQLLAAADDMYWAGLRQPIIGYGQRTAREFIKHMMDRYAKFDEQVRNETEKAMAAPWTTGPFETIINQIELGAATYAQANVALTDQVKCDKLYAIAKQSGRLPQACKKWRFKTNADKTWSHCKEHFLEEAYDLANDETISEAGYANHAQTMERATQALNDSTTRYAMMAKEKQSGDIRLVRLEAELASANAQLAVFQAMMTMPAGNQTRNTNNNNNRRNPRGGNQEWKKLPFYCWTCGYNEKHDSPNCPPTTQQPGHIANATRSNPQSGKGHRGRKVE